MGRSPPKNMARFPLTIFLSAFLLFQIQPMMGKYILPWFGGGPGVWTACLLFFQVLLLAGYGYSHWLVTRLHFRRQSELHLGLLVASLLFLPVAPRSDLGRISWNGAPTAQILLLLLASIGMPYLLLSSTGPLLQRWFHLTCPDRSPYRLYALANAGSLLGLVSYPFLIEPALTLPRQAKMWSWIYAAFILLCGWSAASTLRHRPNPVNAPDSSAPPPSVRATLFWLGLAACGSMLLLATTSQMCQEVAVVPFLWVLPLALYLLSFTISFDNERWYDRRWFGLLVGVAVPASCAVLAAGLAVRIWVHIAVYSVALFVCCMTCFGELVQAKPDPRYLTRFYFVVATGGGLGAVFVAVVAPRLFDHYSEFHLGLAGCCLLGLAGWRRTRAWTQYEGRPFWVTGPLAGLVLALVVALAAAVYGREGKALLASRNFYGILRLTESTEEGRSKRVLTHGRVMHGFQYTDAEKRLWPTAYYSPESGIGLVLQHHPRGNAPPGVGHLTVGVVGLGVGTVAAYGRPGDSFRFYEINPDVAWIADRYFTFRKDSRAKVEVVLGDARVQLEREAASGRFQGFDVLAIDAFNSDAIPTHLLTAECVDLYRKHLNAEGSLLFHISNQSVDLAPVVRGLAARFDWQAVRIRSKANDAQGASQATWVILTNDPALLVHPAIDKAAIPWSDKDLPPLLWTDNFTSLRQVLKF